MTCGEHDRQYESGEWPQRPAAAFDPEHVGPWATRCPRCGTLAPGLTSACAMCRLPNPTPAGYMIPQHDDPEALL